MLNGQPLTAERALVSGQVVRKSRRIFCGLCLNPREGPLCLRFDCSDGLTIQIEQVVRKTEAGLHGKFTYRHAPAHGEVNFVAILNAPSGGVEFQISLSASFLALAFQPRCSQDLATNDLNNLTYILPPAFCDCQKRRI